MICSLLSIWGRVSQSFEFLGKSLRFLCLVLNHLSCRSYRKWIEQIYFCGFLSLPVIFLSGLFVGMVLALQMHYVLQHYGAVESVGYLVSVSLVRELGPVVSALLYAARTGSALTAVIGVMRSREELKALFVMGIDVWEQVFAIRFGASFLVVPLLAIFFSFVGVLGCYVVSVLWFKLDSGIFWINIATSLAFRLDVINGILKSIVFGFIISWTSLFLGYSCPPTVTGMSLATTRAVVVSSLCVFALDFVMTSFMFSL